MRTTKAYKYHRMTENSRFTGSIFIIGMSWYGQQGLKCCFNILDKENSKMPQALVTLHRPSNVDNYHSLSSIMECLKKA